MTEPAFSEKRTRSQLTLPDDILHISDRSPFKGAKTALRNHNVTHAVPSSSKTPSDESDDELLLSPGKKPPMKRSSSSKRSASPPPQDEYALPSGSPPDGRELKRVKRDELLAREIKGDIDHSNATFLFHDHLALGHSRTLSEPDLTRRHNSTRKRPTTKPKKPVSTVNASSTPTIFSSAPVSVKMTRAQSVPIFSTESIFFNAQEGPRIDLTNPPLSPKRRRSPSRSPSKERAPKLRITASGSAGSSGTPKLPTIHDDIIMNIVHSESESNLPQESGTRPIPAEVNVSTPREEIIPASPPSRELVPASPPMRPAVGPSSPPTKEVIPASPSPPPSNSTGLVPPTTLTVPATPATRLLGDLDAMSPLTPLPDTPLPPPRSITDSGVDDRYSDGAGWIIAPMKELTTSQPAKPQPTIAHSTSQSRLPRLSIAPSSVPHPDLSQPQPSAMGPPPVLPAIKKSAIPTVGIKPSASGSKVSKDAFSLMMNKAKLDHAKLEEQRAKPGQVTDKGKKPMRQPPLFTPGPSKLKQQKAKQKMRPREKPESNKPLVIAPLPDEDEDEGESRWGSKFVPDVETKAAGALEAADEALPARVSPAPSADPPEDAFIANNSADTNIADGQIASDTKMAEDGAAQEPQDKDVATSVFSEPSHLELPTDAEDIPNEFPLDKEAQEVQAPMGPSVPANAEATTNKSDEEELPETTEPRPLSRTGKSKLPLGKKRQPMSTAAPARVTRSASNRKNNTVAEGSQASVEALRKKPAPRAVPAVTKRAIAGPAKKPVPAVAVESRQEVAMDVAEEQETALPPGSPMKTSPIRSSPRFSSADKDKDKDKDEQGLQIPVGSSSPASSPTRSKSRMPSASPSPTKIARSTLMAMRPTAASIARTFPSNQLSSAPNSSLSTLSNALEKLRMPPPSRPNTSMGFNRDVTEDDGDDVPVRSKDDVIVGRASVGVGRASGSGGAALQRSATLGSSSFRPKSANAMASSSKASNATGKIFIQKPLSMFMSSKGGIAKSSGVGAGVRRMGFAGSKAPIFGVGGGLGRKISKKSTLPVVMGSPAKGGSKSSMDVDASMREYGEAAGDEGEEEGGSIFNAIVNGSSATHLLENLLAEGSDKGKEKETSTRPAHSSRRVSMLSRDLTHSLSALPPPAPPPVAGSCSGNRGQMGPPPTPPSGGRSAKGTGSSPSSSPSQGGPSGAKRSSARIAKSATAMKASNEGNISAGKKVAAEPPNPAVEALKILKDCVIFVDVKTEDGDEAGSLFVEMLEGVGARVLTRVGQTCTHIVFKNGLMSTITRWKLLRDPKPKVVGIGWVVECIEQRKQVDETDFLIDLMHTNVAGTHKRRRSMLPKLFAEEEPEKDESVDGDRSVDGSVSSITMDDDLTPLERARRRKSMVTGPRP